MRQTLCVIAMAMASCALFAQDQRSTYASALQNYSAGQYEQSCADFRQLYAPSNKLLDVDGSVLRTEKSSMIGGFDWQKKAYESDNSHRWAKECAEWYHAAVRERADNDTM